MSLRGRGTDKRGCNTATNLGASVCTGGKNDAVVRAELVILVARVLRLHNLLEPGREDGADDELQRVLQQQRRAEHREVGAPCEDDLEERQPEGERLVGRAHDEGDAVARLQCTQMQIQMY